MRMIRTYWKVLSASVSNPDYYLELYSSTFWFSFKFFLVTLTILSIASGLWWRLYSFPLLIDSLHAAGSEIRDQIPDSFRLTYADGTVKTEGISLPFNLQNPKVVDDFNFPKNLATVTNDSEASTSFFTFTPKKVFLRSVDNQVDSLSYTDITEVKTATITKQTLTDFMQTGIHFIEVNSTPLSILFGIILFVSALIGGLITIALYSIILQSIAWLFSLRFSYSYMFRWGLHLYPIALGIDTISNILAPHANIPLVSMVYLILGVVIIWRAKTKLKIREKIG
ncbi:MAG: DUF1189 family protein [Candidatus Woesebacteria bacterium]